MAHQIESFEDLVQLLEQQPELRPRLLRVLLTDEFLQVPGRLDKVEEAITKLTRQIDRLEEALTHLTHEVYLLTQDQKELAHRQQRVEERIELFEQGQKVLTDLVQKALEVMNMNINSINLMTRQIESLATSVQSLAGSQTEMRQEIKELSTKLG